MAARREPALENQVRYAPVAGDQLDAQYFRFVEFQGDDAFFARKDIGPQGRLYAGV